MERFFTVQRYNFFIISSNIFSINFIPHLPPSPFAHMVPFAPIYNKVEENKGRAGELEKLYPVLEHKSKYRPYDESRILRKEKGALYVHFPLDKIDLRYNFRDNDWRLDRIIDITRQITADTTSSVEKIQIIGMASVEGTVPHNHWLAQNRGKALKDYVRREVPTVTEDMFEVIDGGEAWTEFRDQINDVRLLKQGQKMDAKQLGVDAYDLALTDADLSQITMEELDQVLGTSTAASSACAPSRAARPTASCCAPCWPTSVTRVTCASTGTTCPTRSPA